MTNAKVKNITFEASTGLKVVINIDSKTTVKDLIKLIYEINKR